MRPASRCDWPTRPLYPCALVTSQSDFNSAQPNYVAIAIATPTPTPIRGCSHYVKESMLRDLVAAFPYGLLSAGVGKPHPAMLLRLSRAILPLLRADGLKSATKNFPYFHYNPSTLRVLKVRQAAPRMPAWRITPLLEHGRAEPATRPVAWQMLLLLLVACHWMGCAWFGISLSTEDDDDGFSATAQHPWRVS